MHTGTCRELVWLLVRWFSVFPGAAATTTTVATLALATRIATTRAPTRTGTMALAPAPNIIKVPQGYAPAAYLFCMGGACFRRIVKIREREALCDFSREHRREALGRANGYGCWQLYPLDGLGLPERKTAYALRKRHARQNGGALLWKSCAI